MGKTLLRQYFTHVQRLESLFCAQSQAALALKGGEGHLGPIMKGLIRYQVARRAGPHFLAQ